MAEKKPKKKRSFKTVLIFFFVGIIIAVFLLTFGYIGFEFNRLSYMNMSLANDWRSYLSYITGKIPFLNNFIKYKYLEIGDPLYVQNEIVSMRLQAIKEQSDEVSVKNSDLQKMMTDISAQASSLAIQKQELEKKSTELTQRESILADYETRVQKLASWFGEATPQQIAVALSRDEVGIDLLVDALYRLRSDSASDILTALSNVNPQKAAQIIAKLGEKQR